MNRTSKLMTFTTAVLLGLGLIARFVVWPGLTPQASRAARTTPSADELRLTGVVYDFSSTHPDFNVTPVEGYGHYAGNVSSTLGATPVPEFIGLGSEEAAEVAGSGSGFSDPIGYNTAFPDTHTDMKEQQIATEVIVPVEVTVNAITAYVGMKDREVRFALYDDDGGSPGDLLTETDKVKSAKETMAWLTLTVPPVTIAPGTYWLALSLKESDHHYAYETGSGTTHIVEHKAVDDGYLTTWGTSDNVVDEAISIYANYTTGDELRIGEDTILPTIIGDVEKQQIATRVQMPEDGTLLSITAYVGNKDKLVRYAIYDDNGGEPGALLAETFNEVASKDSMEWVTLFLADTLLTGGQHYWLAIALEDRDHNIATSAGGGTTRFVDRDAAKDGFLATWGGSDASSTQSISIYGTYATSTGGYVYNGFKVTSPWTDAQARPIAPHLAGIGSDEAIPFEIVDQMVIPAEEFALEVRVMGATIQTGASGYHKPVTMRMDVGGTTFEPFGSWSDPVNGNLNDIQDVTCNLNGTNPRCAVVGTFPGGTGIAVDGRCWSLDGGNGCIPTQWDIAYEVSTTDNDEQLWVLRNGDPAPDVEGAYEQASAASYLSDYVDQDTGLITLGENQVIYLYELGVDGDSSSADFQDLVVVITLARDAAGLCSPTGTSAGNLLCGEPFGDSDGEATPGGQIDASGGISSAESFAQWYRMQLGVNMTAAHEITLVNDGSGVYEHLTDSFHPIDGEALGNDGDAHNYYFTYTVEATFIHETCAGQFIEFEGDDDLWIFIDGDLVLDLGGMHPGTSQIIELDRLGLNDGQEYQMRLFHAQRQNVSSVFNLRTNIRLGGPDQVTISGGYD